MPFSPKISAFDRSGRQGTLKTTSDRRTRSQSFLTVSHSKRGACLTPLAFRNIKINGGPGCPNPPFSSLPLCQLGLLQSACCRQCLCIWVRAQRISQVRVSRRCEIANQHVACGRLLNQRLCVGHEKEALLDRLVRSRCHNADIAGMGTIPLLKRQARIPG